MEEHNPEFDLNAARHADGFVIVDHIESGWQIVRHCLRLAPRVVERVLATPGVQQLKGRELYKALLGLGAFAANAMRNADGHLVPLPPRNKREGLQINDIIPALQKFHKESECRFLVKYSDHMDLSGAGLDDPLPGVAAHREISTQPPYHTVYLAHFDNDRPFAPPADDKGHRKAEEQCYYADNGHVQWIRNRRSYGGTLPLFEVFDKEGHPLYLENKERTADGHVTIVTETFSETTGDVLHALRQNKDGTHPHVLTPAEIQKLPKPEDPTLSLG